MKFKIWSLILVTFLACSFNLNEAKFTPDWKSLDSRVNPEWYDQSKFGIFVHWGVYSVIGKGEWLWQHWRGFPQDNETVAYMNKHYPGVSYADFGSKFTAEEFDADEFAAIVNASGARYLVLTSKHHEGYTLYPSRTSFSWNSMDLGPKRDLVKEVQQAILKTPVHFGLYFSQYEWFHPLYLMDQINGTSLYPEQISVPQMYEIVNKYSPEILWSDGDWDREDSYWKTPEFIAWLFNESPVKNSVLVNDRWGQGIMGKHGSYITGGDRWMPGKLIDRKWEYCMTLDSDSWGYRRNMKFDDVLSIREVLTDFVKTLSWGGNIIINVGPNRLGRIPTIFEERLRQLGEFTNAYGEAIFGTKPWIYQAEDERVWYTSRLRNESGLDAGRAFNPQDQINTIVYAFTFDWNNSSGWIGLDHVKYSPKVKITLLGTDVKLNIRSTSPLVAIMPPYQNLPYKEIAVLKVEYSASSNFKPKVWPH